MTRGRKPAVDTTDAYLGNANPLTIGEIGRGDEDTIEPVNDFGVVEQEAFMNEVLTVVAMSTGKDNEARLFKVGVNGVNQFFALDTPQEVKRKYVERLARMKETNFDQALDDRFGEESFNTITRRHALTHPFQVIYDPNPKGPAWLKGVLAEAN